ncbi:MAG: alanine--tRNA ligase [Candidatus Woesearchaeota archaeon]
MPTDKEIKREFKLLASKEPDRFYATSVLKEEGFMRRQCKCGTFFWTVNTEQMTCGDPACSGGFRFIGKSPTKNEMDYIQVWQEFSKLFTRLGYTPIKRYPVVARWRDDTDFVQASIYDFQPYVVSGEVEPPANPLVVPQVCLRFNDIDNIGITGAHYCAFVMIGQHAFMPEEKWNQAKVFLDIYTWLKEGLGLPNEEITFHEDAWAGGGNFGPCMEYFSRGLELGNQVYMLFEQTPNGPKPLKLKVLDMGMGHERNAWFTKGKSTSYETTFPTVAKKLYNITGIKVDKELMQKFLPYSGYLNIDEVEDINKAWANVAKNIGVDANELKNKVLPLAALYSVGEHSRALLFALSDGALPSNVGGGYNLRMILRRALSFIEKYGWDIDMGDLAEWHAEYLKPLFPELSMNMEQVRKILDVEKRKYMSTRAKSMQIVKQIMSKEIDSNLLVQLYDSQGISPEVVKEEAERLGKRVDVPQNFYTLVSGMHEKKEQLHATQKADKLDVEGIPDTKVLYYDDYTNVNFEGIVLKIIGNKVILNQTAFYPTSGGQMSDTGILGGERVNEVIKQGAIIIHVLEKEPSFSVGDSVTGRIDFERRKQLAQNHTATHIVNAAVRKLLGKHIHQAGAKKSPEKAHLDITHYESLSSQELKEIEEESNRIVKSNAPVKSFFLPRTKAEQRYGMEIYQGGAVPGKIIRIVEIEGTDAEACGGTHLHTTSEVGEIKILKSTKIQDGIVRITFTTGRTALSAKNSEANLILEAASLLNCKPSQVPARAKELFDKWKSAKKGKLEKFELVSSEEFNGDALTETARILKTQPEHIVRTIKRFLEDIKN